MRVALQVLSSLLIAVAGTGTAMTTATLQDQESSATHRELSGLPADAAILRNYRSARVSSEDRPGNFDKKVVQPGETLVLADIEGPAEITHIWTTLKTKDPNHLRNIVFRIYWDDNEYPSVECPLGDFFGQGHCKYYQFSNPMQAMGSRRGMNCFWPMPFQKRARITATNEGPLPVEGYFYYIDYKKLDRMPENVAYFHAQYRQAFPNVDGQNYTFMETSGGRGHYMGVNLSVHTQTWGWWGEGDDIITIDGEEVPSIWGTGSEDYFNGAFGFGETFYTDYHGVPYRESLDNRRPDSYWNVYRLHLEAPITFTKSIKVEMEHGDVGFNNTRKNSNNDYSSCAYWYVDNPRPLVGSLPPAKERLPRFRPTNAHAGVIEAQYLEREPRMEDINIQPMIRNNHRSGDWMNNNHLHHRSAKADNTVTFRFETTSTAVNAGLVRTRAPDYARYRLKLDGRDVGTIDAYNDHADRARVPLGPLDDKRTSHVLTLTVEGKNPKSKNTRWALDYLDFNDAPIAVDAGLPVLKPE